LVFDGRKGSPYVESDVTSPLNVYGASKAAAEERVLEEFPEALVIRTSVFFGPWDSYNFVHSVLHSLSKGRAVYAAEDITISPTYVPDLVNATLDLLIDDEKGIWHVASPAVITWAGFAHLVAEKAGYDTARIHHRPSRSLGFIAARPSFTPLSSERGNFMPSLEESIDRFFKDRKWARPPGAVSARH
jgi:dTDP-4-dehydrorhamnose reductase